jgi:multiple sugar transport system substrate-binding protein
VDEYPTFLTGLRISKISVKLLPMVPRFYKLIIFIVLASFGLSACQGGAGLPTAAPTPEATPSVTATLTPTPTVILTPTATLPPHLLVDPGSLRGVTVDFWHPWRGALETQVNQSVAQFNRGNEWGVQVRARSLYNPAALTSALDEVLAEAALDEEAPEVVAAATHQLASLADYLLDLDEYVDHEQVGLGEQAGDFLPAFWLQDRPGDIRLGIPALRSAQVLFYNITWAQDLGYSVAPRTPEMFRQQACAAAAVNNQSNLVSRRGTGGWLADVSPLTGLSWMHAFGAEPLPETPGSPYRFDSEAAQSSLQWLRRMYNDGCAWVGRSPDPYTYFADRMALFYSGSLEDIFLQQAAMERTGSEDRWVILPFPSLSGETFVYSGGDSYALTRSTPEKQMAAWLFVRWMSRPTVQAGLGQVLPSIPVSSAAAAQFTDYTAHYPWGMILPLSDQAEPAPGDASWRLARRIVEDGMRQLYYIPEEQLSGILPEIDQMIEDLRE